jgi:diguanylate cyclase (GGDEF)-like protein
VLTSSKRRPFSLGGRLRCDCRDLVAPFRHAEALRMRRKDSLWLCTRIIGLLSFLHVSGLAVWAMATNHVPIGMLPGAAWLFVVAITLWVVIDGRTGAGLRRHIPCLPVALLMVSVCLLCLVSRFDAGIDHIFLTVNGLLLLGLMIFVAVMPLTLIELAMVFISPAVLGALGLFGGITGLGGQLQLAMLIAAVVPIASMASLLQMYRTTISVREIAIDPLTGVYCRAFGTEMLEIGFEASRRVGRPFALAFVDLDDFKAVNDRFGHDRGDRILADTGANLIERLRKADVVIRWGGEEFVILLPGLSAGQARDVIDRVCSMGIATTPDGQPQYCSIGIAERLADDATQAMELIDLADRRMYVVKQSRGNMVSSDDDAMATSGACGTSGADMLGAPGTIDISSRASLMAGDA